MKETILAINPGSASMKCALFREGTELARAHFEIEDSRHVVALSSPAGEHRRELTAGIPADATGYFLAFAASERIIASPADIRAVGVRVVAPGNYFLRNRIIDDACIAQLKSTQRETPLHTGPALAEIENIQSAFAHTPLAAISDSAFYANLPARARHYAIPKSDAQRFGIYRFGYHGISAQSIIRKLSAQGELPHNIIICHLGSGSSIIAVKDGTPLDVSMGFTPLEGAVMGTRVGAIDAGAVLYLAQKLETDLDELKTYFNSRCGLLGVSGISNDVRVLLKREEAGDADAALALELFVYQIKKHIGAYAAALNGVDLLVFSATIGERSHIMRGRICREMESFGLAIDGEKNLATASADALINAASSAAKIAVIATDELGEIARETAALL